MTLQNKTLVNIIKILTFLIYGFCVVVIYKDFLHPHCSFIVHLLQKIFSTNKPCIFIHHMVFITFKIHPLFIIKTHTPCTFLGKLLRIQEQQYNESGRSIQNFRVSSWENKTKHGITETAAALAKHFGQERKWDQEQNDVGGAFFTHPGNQENSDYWEKKPSLPISSLSESNCTLAPAYFIHHP